MYYDCTITKDFTHSHDSHGENRQPPVSVPQSTTVHAAWDLSLRFAHCDGIDVMQF